MFSFNNKINTFFSKDVLNGYKEIAKTYIDFYFE